MNIQEYTKAVKGIHNMQAMTLWSLYSSKRKPLTKEYILKRLPSFGSNKVLDECLSYLLQRGFKVLIKE